MIASVPPFSGEDSQRYHRILNCDVHFSAKYFSARTKDFVCGFLKTKAADRLGVAQGGTSLIKDHPWYTEANFDWSALRARTMKAPHIPEIADLGREMEDDGDEENFREADSDDEHYWLEF